MVNQRPFFKSLRGKVSLQMLIVSLVPILIVGGLVYNSMSSAEDNASTSLDNTRAQLDEDITDARNTLQHETVGKGVKAVQAWNLSVDLETWMAERVAEINSWARNSVIVRVAESSIDEDKEAWKFLGEETEGTPFYENAWLADLSGNTIAETSIFDTGSKSENPVFQKALETGLCVGDAYLGGFGSSITKVFFVDVAVRVEDAMSGEAYGVVAGVVEFNPATIGQRYAEKVPGSRVVIWDRFKNLITDSDNPERYMEQTQDWTPTEAAVMEKITGNVERIEGNYIINDDFVAGYASATNDDVNIRHTGYDGLGWMIMVEQPAEDAFAALSSLDVDTIVASLEDLESDLEDNTSSMVLLLVIVIMVVIVIVPVLAFFLSRGITRPIAHLSNAAEKVSMGDLEVTVDVKSDDEIGDLADSFGRMVTAVKFLSEDED